MRLSAYVGLLVAALPFAVVACDDKPPPKPPAPVAAPVAATATVAPVATKAGPEYAESDFLENDRNRDPFRAYLELFGDTAGSKRPQKTDRRVVLSQYPLEELKLAAIVQGGDYPRAMVIPPSGKGSVIKRGDFVGHADVVHTGGTNGTDYLVNWRVDRIREGDVVLVREDPAHIGSQVATKVIPLHPDSEKSQQQQDDDLLNQGQDQL
jgi:type IV pilus assembly protein PilP